MTEDHHETFTAATTPEGTATGSLELATKDATESNGPSEIPFATGDPEGLDWDVQIEAPPPRPSQTVLVRFVEAGWRPIALPDDPED